ncbi:tripartite motif-containing protein 3-like [Branchiostoma lanceolatum]|uniref:tripartite motif-containing protein 3-like n=1 Tax=Branchiostoma lanceolatum TaxID=7740 RepID=UPI003456E7E7
MATGSSTTDRILEDFLSCGICFEPFTKPKALPCQHTFCQKCLEGQHKQWLEDCRKKPREQQQPFRCSMCREPVTLSSEGVEGLPNSHLAANLCEEFSKKTQVENQKNKCGFHPTKDVDLFCQQCEVPICSECIGDGHPGHNVTGVKQVAPKIKANIRAQLNNSQQQMETFSAFLKEIQDVQKRLTDNKTHLQQEIIKAFEVQFQKLQEQRDRLLATVEKNHQDNMVALTGQRDTVLTQLAELSRVCEDAEDCLKQEEPVWLTQDYNLAQKLAKYENTETPEICEIKLCHFEQKKSDALIELGKVTSQSMSHMQVLVHSKETNTGEVKSTKVRPIRVGQPWVRKVRFGGRGSGRGEFNCPIGVAVSQHNDVYIADYGNSRIQVFTMDGVYIREFPTTLPGETGRKFNPQDVAVDRNDNLWVVSYAHVVQYSREGTCLAKIDLPDVDYDRGITVAMATEQVIVTTFEHDGQNGRLNVFNYDGSKVGTYGSGHRSPKPWWPQYVTVDGEGNILVTDNKNHCVHVLDREGNFKFKFGSEGSGESQFKHPRGICVDGMGNIIVADYGNGCVKIFDSQGRFLCHVGSRMEGPWGVAVSPGGDVVVTQANSTVSIWTKGWCCNIQGKNHAAIQVAHQQ